MVTYTPYGERTPDTQYRDILRIILEHGELIAETPQDVPAITYLAPNPMRFELKNGAPLITERSISFWKRSIGEILAFINGVHTLDGLKEFGCEKFWANWATERKCGKIGVSTGDMGPGSYGPAFTAFPRPYGSPFNQIHHVVTQLKDPNLRARRTIMVSPHIPFYIGWGINQKAVVTPCHGWLYFRVMGDRLYMEMHQRSADMPIGVPSNMIQYSALLIAIAQVTGLTPSGFIHSFWDAHIYSDQAAHAKEMLTREPRKFPTLTLDPGITDLFSIRPHHFTLSDYEPHPAIPDIPVAV